MAAVRRRRSRRRDRPGSAPGSSASAARQSPARRRRGRAGRGSAPLRSGPVRCPLGAAVRSGRPEHGGAAARRESSAFTAHGQERAPEPTAEAGADRIRPASPRRRSGGCGAPRRAPRRRARRRASRRRPRRGRRAWSPPSAASPASAEATAARTSAPASSRGRPVARIDAASRGTASATCPPTFAIAAPTASSSGTSSTARAMSTAAANAIARSGSRSLPSPWRSASPRLASGTNGYAVISTSSTAPCRGTPRRRRARAEPGPDGGADRGEWERDEQQQPERPPEAGADPVARSLAVERREGRV